MRQSIAALTGAERVYPPYINVGADGDNVVVALRGDPTVREFGGVASSVLCGASLSATFTREEFARLVAELSKAYL